MTSILDFGGSGDGTTPNDYAFAAWLATLTPAGGVLKFPGAGVYCFNSPLAITLASNRSAITLEGDGSNLSCLLWQNAGGGISITSGGCLNSVHIRGLSVLTGALGGGVALALNSSFWMWGCWSTIDDVMICGSDGPSGTQYWNNAAIFSGWGGVNCYSLNTFGAKGLGNGVKVNGQASSSLYAVLFNFDSCSFNDHAYGLIYGGYVQGVTVNQCNFNGEHGAAGIASITLEPGVLALLSVTGSQFDYGGPAILLATAIDSVQLSNNTFTVTNNGQSAVYLEGAFQFNSSGNYFNVNTNTNPHPAGMFGLVIGPPGFGTSNGDCFKDITTPINLKPGTSNILIGANRYYPTCGANIDSGVGNVWLTAP